MGLAETPKWLVFTILGALAALAVFVLFTIFIILLLTVTIPAIQDSCHDTTNYCSTRSGLLSATQQTIFASLSADEHRDVTSWLLSQASFNLTPIAQAGLQDNYIFYIDAMPPNKTEALAYLDHGGPKPKRYAHVVLYLCHEQKVQEFKVGPLPTSAETTAQRWDTETYKGVTDIPFNSRIPDDIEYAAIDEKIMVPLAEQLSDIFLESYGAKYNPNDEVSLTYTDSAPRSSATTPNTRQTWFFWVYSVDGLWIQAVGFETLVEHNSTNPDEFKLLQLVYNGQAFSTVSGFKTAYEMGTIEKINMQVNKDWASFTRQGDPFPGDDIPGSRHIEPRGNRYNVSGNHIEYSSWQFDWSINPLSGVSLWDVRFRGERIVYEVGTQEIFVPYSGRNPSQVNSLYMDTAWGFGASAFPLREGVDCPETATFLDVVQLYGTGEPEIHKNAICVFEKDAAMALRRHFDIGDPYNFYAGSAKHVLVFRHAITDYNYDYVLDYEFYPTGAMQVLVAATGYLQGTYWLDDDQQYGSHRVGPNGAGTLHQHIFSYKVDIDVLGTANTLRATSFPIQAYNAPWFDVPKTRPVPKHTYVTSENNSTFFPDYNNPMMFVFTNNGSKNEWGMERGYRFQSTSFMKNLYDTTGAFPEAISWTKYQLAVVKRKEDEPTVNNVYAQARAFDASVSSMRSLDSWLDGDSLKQEDLVAWVNIGVTHYPHAEDVPVTVTSSNHASFWLSPYNYFSRDPASALRDTTLLRPDPITGAAVQEPDPLIVPQAGDCYYVTHSVSFVGPGPAP